jgi:hypothetical protein
MPSLADSWTIFITGDDSAFIPVVELFQCPSQHLDEVTHVLCTWHEERNFLKKMN